MRAARWGHELLEAVAQALARDRVVGWFQERMEFGPRALGGRSILASPLRPSLQETVNRKVKFREGFRPFAPVLPIEEAPRFFGLGYRLARRGAMPGRQGGTRMRIERMIADLVRHARAAELDVSALLLLASLGARDGMELRWKEEALSIPENHYPH
jgi:post-segregation antitoxin (ccd killing protein)